MPFQGAAVGKLVTAYGDNISVDTMTDALNTVDYAHHEVHGGSMFHVSYVADIGNGANLDIGVTTPNTSKHSHMVIGVGVEAEARLYLYEDATFSGGTPLTAYNRNRNSSTAATSTVVHTPSITSTGTLILGAHYGSARTYGGESRAQNEWILKQNAKYLLRVTNLTTNNNFMDVELDWYEHTTP